MRRQAASAEPAVPRPWGGYSVLLRTRTTWIKKLFIRAGERTSLQHHRWRSEIWHVRCGEVGGRLGSMVRRCAAGDTILVPRGRRHRITALNDACVLEVASGRGWRRTSCAKRTTLDAL